MRKEEVSVSNLNQENPPFSPLSRVFQLYFIIFQIVIAALRRLTDKKASQVGSVDLFLPLLFFSIFYRDFHEVVLA
jgi:hypothetical protein